jgi:hypothetical protein
LRLIGTSSVFFEGAPKDQIPLEATTDHPTDITSWLAAIKRLIDDRIVIEHIPQPSTAPLPHPVYPTNVAAIAAYFVAERAIAVVDLLLDFYHRTIECPSSRLELFGPRSGNTFPVASTRSDDACQDRIARWRCS